MPQLTGVLYKIKPTWHWKQKWRNLGETRKLSLPEIPKPFRKEGITIINAADEQKKHDAFVEEYCEWEEDHPQFIGPPGHTPRNPRWKDEPARIFDKSSKLLEGIEQMQVITKTLAIRGMPPAWQQLEPLVQPYHLPDEDERVRRYVMQSVRWDPSRDKLPKRDFVYGHTFPIYHGISLPRANDLLDTNLLRLTEMSFAGKPDLLKRHVIKDALCHFKWKRGNDRIVFDCNCRYMVSSEKELAPFATKDEVEQTKDYALPSIYPIKFNIALDETNVYDWDYRYPFTDDCSFKVPHTIFVHHNHPDEWTISQKHAQALGHIFAASAAYAKRVHGEDVKELPRPISLQCVFMDRGRRFLFYAFQLNTLDVDSLLGVKNQLWIHADEHIEYVNEEMVRTEIPFVMFTLADQMEGLMGYQEYLERNTRVRYPIRSLNSYNPEIMKKLLTLYANQLNLESREALAPPVQPALTGNPADLRVAAVI